METNFRAHTGFSPPMLQDDFGVPVVFAIDRAARFPDHHHLRNRIALVASGNMRSPGDMLKALALGADAVYIGSAALFAVTHTQVLNALPFELPTQVVWYNGEQAANFDAEAGAVTMANYLAACRAELQEGVRALGKQSVSEVCRDDLMALDQMTARFSGVPLAAEAVKDSK